MRQLQGRQYIVKGIFLSVILILLIKLFYIQIVDSQYKKSAKKNAIRFEVQQAARGLIYDRNKKLIVSNVASYDLMVIPREVQEFDTLSLCELAEITKEEFKKTLQEAKDYSDYKESVFSKQLNTVNAHKIQELLNTFNGFYIRVNTTRDYPVDVAAHVIGYLGEVRKEKTKEKYYTKGDLEGRTGIEASYEESLRGSKGMKLILVDSRNRPQGSFNNGKHDSLAIHGRNIITTLNIDLQEYGELLMQNKIGAIVAIEPSTGEILTLITAPNYNPNDMKGRARSDNYTFMSLDENKPLFNRALKGTYPPASPLKLVNSLIFLQEESLNKNNTYFCNMGFEFGNKRRMGCHEHPSPVNLKTAIAMSCNSYFCNVWENFYSEYNTVQEGYLVWKEHIESFGFGNYLNNDFKLGTKGFVPNADYFDKYYKRWKSSTILSMSIGQGELEVSPIQMANLSAILANRGYYYIPHIIKEIENDTIPSKFKQKNYSSIAPKHFTTVIDGMEMVFNLKDGTSIESKVEGITICGKTGTAENPHGEDHSIFIAFAPKENPEIAIAVYVENGGWGSTWAAPIATLMIEQYLKGNTDYPNRERKMINGNLLKL
jgi:penicillin-binding protein 2